MKLKKKPIKNYEVQALPKNIVRVLRDLENNNMRFKFFITLTFRVNPAENLRGCNNITVKRICRTLITKSNINCIFLCLENDRQKKKHYHLAIDGFVNVNVIRNYWKHGYVHIDAVKLHEKVKNYLKKKMGDSSPNFRLYYQREKILERYLESFQKHRYK